MHRNTSSDMRLLATTLLAMGAIFATACGDDDGDSGRRDGGPMDGSVDDGGPLDPGQTVEVIDDINDVEIDLAELAVARAQLETVREYAQLMITEHEAADVAFDTWEDAENVVSVETPLSRRIEADGDRTARQLSTLSGEAFDTAYIASQVEMHSEVLTIIDTRLLPDATGTLRTLLTDYRAMVAEHLTMAEQIQAGMGDVPGPTTP